jgi:DNA-binding CsgD family transcriptional regulator
MAGRSKPRADSAPDARLTPFRLSTEDLVVVSFPVDAQTDDVVLTDAERAIAAAIREGQSNAAIARARGTSVRTVANQVAMLFRKLGVSSRVELIAALYRPTGRS